MFNHTLNIEPANVVYNATDIPWTNEATIFPTSSGLLETDPSTPDRAIIKPITVPINPNMTNMLAINFILLILTDILILVEEIRLDLELASNFLAFFKKLFNMDLFLGWSE